MISLTGASLRSNSPYTIQKQSTVCTILNNPRRSPHNHSVGIAKQSGIPGLLRSTEPSVSTVPQILQVILSLCILDSSIDDGIPCVSCRCNRILRQTEYFGCLMYRC